MILDALDELSFLALGPLSKPRGRTRQRVTVMLLAHGIGRGVAAHQNRKPFHPSSQSSTKSSTQIPAYGSSQRACHLLGRPAHLSVASTWPMPGRPSPSQGHKVTHARLPSLPYLDYLPWGSWTHIGWAARDCPGTPHPARHRTTHAVRRSSYTHSTCGRRGASPT